MPAFSPELSSELRRGITEHKLDAVADVIFHNSAECYAMVVEDVEDYSVPGNTRFGGEPDLPPSSAWPCNGDPDDSSSRFSNFIAQINFAELPLLGAGTPLPSSGILYLFVRYMECAAEPVLMDALFYDGEVFSLRRTPTPNIERLADEYLVDLEPVKIRAVPAVSIATYRKAFRTVIDGMGDDFHKQRIALESDLSRVGQIGQMLGFANAGDERKNLYRQLYLARLGKRELTYNDYWDSIEEYEAHMDTCRHRGSMVKGYEKMRSGVTWLVNNHATIARGVAEWRHLFRIDSNSEMNLNMMDADPLYVFIRDENLAKRDFSDLAGEVTQG